MRENHHIKKVSAVIRQMKCLTSATAARGVYISTEPIEQGNYRDPWHKQPAYQELWNWAELACAKRKLCLCCPLTWLQSSALESAVMASTSAVHLKTRAAPARPSYLTGRVVTTSYQFDGQYDSRQVWRFMYHVLRKLRQGTWRAAQKQVCDVVKL